MTEVASQIEGGRHGPLISVAMAGEGASPLIKRFATTDPDNARSEVQNCHPWIRGYEPLGPSDRFQHSRMQIRLGRITMTRSRFSHVRLATENDDKVVLVLAERGWRSVRGRGAPLASTDGMSALLMPRGRSVYENGPDSAGFVVSVPAAALAQSFDFVPRSRDAEPLLVHLSTAEGLRFRSTLNFIFLQLAQLQASFTPSLTAAYEDVLLAGLGALIPDGRERPRPRDPGARLVRQACELIAQAAGEPLRLTEVAVTLGISLRHLQAGFRRHLNTTPQSFLKDCRLEHALQRLSFAAPDETAASIAKSCGFTHPGQFAGDYRRRFGESPSDTLRRWRLQ